MFGISFSFTLIIRIENKLYFEFKPIEKFFYVYEGILSGLFFCIFIVVYLSQSSRNNLRLALSSEIFVFVHKISFILFNIFFSVLEIFHSINILEIHLNTLNLIRNTITLYSIICLLSILIAVFIFFPIKWIYFFIINGFNYDEKE